MKNIIKIIKVVTLIILSGAFIFSLQAQEVKQEIRLRLNYNKVFEKRADVITPEIGVKSSSPNVEVKILVFEDENYTSSVGTESPRFLFGFSCLKKANEWNSSAIATINREYWDPTSIEFDKNTIKDVSLPSTDLTYFKSRMQQLMKRRDPYFNSLKDNHMNVIVRMVVTGSGANINQITGIRLPGVDEFIPKVESYGSIKVFRGDDKIPIINLNITTSDFNYDLVTFQGDKVVFEARKEFGNAEVENLTDLSILRWAGESLFIVSNIKNVGEIRPFLFFDSNVHGIKMRRFPENWNGNPNYPKFISTNNNLNTFSWIANGRFDFNENIQNIEGQLVGLEYLSASKEGVNGKPFPNQNKFFGDSTEEELVFQRNNQREGINMEILDEFLRNEGNTSSKPLVVAGLDPDELIYKNFPHSNILENKTKITDFFEYVPKDRWKMIPFEHKESINSSLFYFLTKVGQFISGNVNYSYSGKEVGDLGLYKLKSNKFMLEGREFDNMIKQPMFNNKRPVYYDDSFENKPEINKRHLEYSIGNRVFRIRLAVLSPLEGARIGKSYNQITAEDRKNAKVNFYGTIEGPKHLARYQKNVTFRVRSMPQIDAVPGAFFLVYTYEDYNGIEKQKRKRIHRDDNSFTFDFEGGGNHEITLRYQRNKDGLNTEEVIIAGKELMDIDLRFIFSPNSEDGADFSYNPKTTFGEFKSFNDPKIAGLIRLGENKASGHYWFLEHNIEKLKSNNYANFFGYDDHSVIRTYTLDRNEVIKLTVLDADPHTFVHYQPDFYLSERRLSKRLQDGDLERVGSQIQWFASRTRDFSASNKIFLGNGRYCKVEPLKIYPTYKGDFFVQAQYNDGFPITVKFTQVDLDESLDKVVKLDDGDNLGSISVHDLSQTQWDIVSKLAPNFYTGDKSGYKLLRIRDILSAYSFGHVNRSLNSGMTAVRYTATKDKNGNDEEVGEHKRFSDMNNYKSTFKWVLKNVNSSIPLTGTLGIVH